MFPDPAIATYVAQKITWDPTREPALTVQFAQTSGEGPRFIEVPVESQDDVTLGTSFALFLRAAYPVPTAPAGDPMADPSAYVIPPEPVATPMLVPHAEPYMTPKPVPPTPPLVPERA